MRGFWVFCGTLTIFCCGCGIVGFWDMFAPVPSPKIRIGMTVLEVSEVWPGKYHGSLAFEELPRPDSLTKAAVQTFTGELRVRRPDGAEETIMFVHGASCLEPDPADRNSLTGMIPVGTSVESALGRLPSGIDVRLEDARDSERVYWLPEASEELAGYTGVLRNGLKGRITTVEFRRGKVVDFSSFIVSD